MTRYRLTASARRDVNSIWQTSEHRHGREARARYAALLLAAMHRVAELPEGRSTSHRGDIRPGFGSFRIRHQTREAPIGKPVHVIFYRIARPGIVDAVRVLHERMEPERHLGSPSQS
jgi:toxin ParE1/3/4